MSSRSPDAATGEDFGFFRLWASGMGGDEETLMMQMVAAVEAADVAVNWNEKRVIPTPEVPDQVAAIRRARELIDVVR